MLAEVRVAAISSLYIYIYMDYGVEQRQQRSWSCGFGQIGQGETLKPHKAKIVMALLATIFLTGRCSLGSTNKIKTINCSEMLGSCIQ